MIDGGADLSAAQSGGLALRNGAGASTREQPESRRSMKNTTIEIQSSNIYSNNKRELKTLQYMNSN